MGGADFQSGLLPILSRALPSPPRFPSPEPHALSHLWDGRASPSAQGAERAREVTGGGAVDCSAPPSQSALCSTQLPHTHHLVSGVTKERERKLGWAGIPLSPGG